MREGARQPHRFDPARAARLDDPARFDYLPPAEIITLLALEHRATLVDFGAGTGLYAIEIARARPDLTIIALDEQAAMLELLAQRLAASGVSTVEPADPNRLADLQGRADRILALNVLHELGDVALADVRALLRPRGRALFVDWNADVDRPLGPRREHVYGVTAALERLAANGWRAAEVKLFAYHYALVAEPLG